MKFQYQPEPLDTGELINEFNLWSIDDPGLNSFLETNGMEAVTLETNEFSFRRLYLTGMYYNPEMQTAYRKWKKVQLVVNHSNYRINPEISIPLEYHSDTSGGISPWTIGGVLSFIYERKGKRDARQAEAEVDLLNARLEMDKIASEYYERFHVQYHAFIVARLKIKELENEIDILNELLGHLQKQFELGGGSQFEISTIKLELQQRRFEMSLQDNKLQQFRDNLFAMTQLAYSEYNKINIEEINPIIITRSLFQEQDWFQADLTVLQSRLLNTHLDLALQLNRYAQSEARLRLEIEKQYPDIVLSPGFIFDQSDNIWTLGASWILPLFNNSKQDLEILKALEERKVKQLEIIALQKNLLNSLFTLHKSLSRHDKTINESNEIIDAIEKRANVLQQQINQGGIDKIALLRNRMEFYKALLTQTEIYHAALNAMHDFEHLLQHSHLNIDIKHIVALWISNLEEKQTDEPYN